MHRVVLRREKPHFLTRCQEGKKIKRRLDFSVRGRIMKHQFAWHIQFGLVMWARFSTTAGFFFAYSRRFIIVNKSKDINYAAQHMHQSIVGRAWRKEEFFPQTTIAISFFSRKNSSNYVVFNMRKLMAKQQRLAWIVMTQSASVMAVEGEGNEQLTAARIWMHLLPRRFSIYYSIFTKAQRKSVAATAVERIFSSCFVNET